jgi:hypothetical protein
MSQRTHRLNLEQQKTRAKELRDAVRAGAREALARVRAHHPRAAGLGDGELFARLDRLSDAQLVIARELGLPSWPALKAHLESLDEARRAIATRAPAPDGETPTLHVRCGSDIQRPLKDAGFVGDFLEVSDPLCMGPVPRDADFVQVRARFLGATFGLDPAAIATSYAETLARLDGAAAGYRRVALWFEHDSYDQLILAEVLARLGRTTRPAQLELICIDAFPAIAPFIGLGQLEPEALRHLWKSRAPVTPEQLRLGAAVWDALREPDPSALFAIAAGGTPELPVMAAALHRHLQELPWTRDGLSLSQHLALEALRPGPLRGMPLFRRLQELEPLPFLGDSMLWAILSDLERVAEPPFTTDGSAEWPQRTLTLTATGEALLAGTRDWLALDPPERWVGGVRVAPGARGWRWSAARDRIVPA